MSTDVLVRTYTGSNQSEAAARYGEDAVRLAADGWVASTQAWVEGEWPLRAYVAAGLLVLVGIGIAILVFFVLVKPKRTLMVTYRRASSSVTAEPAA